MRFATETGLWDGEVGEVHLLGHDAALDWSQAADALVIQMPPQTPGEFAYAVKITRATV